MGDIEDAIQDKAKDAKDSSAEQHLGDAMDDADQAAERESHGGEMEAPSPSGSTPAGGQPQKNQGDPLEDVNLEPPSS